MTVSKKIRTILGKSPDIRRSPCKNKVPMEKQVIPVQGCARYICTGLPFPLVSPSLYRRPWSDRLGLPSFLLSHLKKALKPLQA